MSSSFLTGDSLKSSSDSSSSRLSPPFLHTQHTDISNSLDQSAPSIVSSSPTDNKDKNNTTTTRPTKTKREVYKYENDWLVSSIAWSYERSDSFELAVGSFLDEYCNKINIVRLSKDSCDEELELITTFDHPYPPTKISWIPKPVVDTAQFLPRLLATSADYLRIWRIPEAASDSCFTNDDENFNTSTNKNVTECDSTTTSAKEQVKQIVPEEAEEVKLECSLSPNENAKFRSPLTSFDWNEIDPKIIITSSVDTTCAVWDLEVGTAISSCSADLSYQLKNQILAHDHEVYDVSFSRQASGREIFATAGADGSLRLFDLRMLSTSTVLYETNADSGEDSRALVRLACNKQDPNYISTFQTSSKEVALIDVRRPGKTVALLSRHKDQLNGISWAPHSAHHLCSAADDGQALIWGLPSDLLQDEPKNEPLLAYRAGGKINAINWSSAHPEWIAIGFENCLELLRV